jgi:hypothetical protein
MQLLQLGLNTIVVVLLRFVAAGFAWGGRMGAGADGGTAAAAAAGAAQPFMPPAGQVS